MKSSTTSIGFFHRFQHFLMSFFFSHSKHVRISAKGRKVLSNRQLVRKVVDAVIENKDDLDKGGSVTIKGDGREIELSLSGVTEPGNSHK